MPEPGYNGVSETTMRTDIPSPAGDRRLEAAEDEAYLTQQLITYLGNKRALLDFIGQGLSRVKDRLGKSRLSVFDVFSGSGAVSRYLKGHANLLISNDIEKYAKVVGDCYLSNRSELDLSLLKELHAGLSRELDSGPLCGGIVSELYAPRDDGDIKAGERVFYTTRNARYLDTARALIDGAPEALRPFFLAPLLSEASVHANTSGVFKGFYKNAETGLGTFGGRKGDALTRIKGDIRLPFPVLSRFECETEVLRGDSNAVAAAVREVDLAYLDPPYNQHPYGSNYFMLNLIVDNQRPAAPSRVSGIPADWQRSRYNKALEAAAALAELVEKLKARFLLVSFNSEGFIPRREMERILGAAGKVDVLETRYNAFRGSRNLRGRSLHVQEYLYLVEKA
jgi:adenine-specific DNA-methyltransferase